MSELEWVAIKKFKPEPIGAVGFYRGKAVAVTSHRDERELGWAGKKPIDPRDANGDGRVSFKEKVFAEVWGVQVGITLSAKIAEVAMQARMEPSIIERDPTFLNKGAKIFANFARARALEGVYTVYFAGGVDLIGGGVVKRITANRILGMALEWEFQKIGARGFTAAMNHK